MSFTSDSAEVYTMGRNWPHSILCTAVLSVVSSELCRKEESMLNPSARVVGGVGAMTIAFASWFSSFFFFLLLCFVC